jgi:hypothetical protein
MHSDVACLLVPAGSPRILHYRLHRPNMRHLQFDIQVCIYGLMFNVRYEREQNVTCVDEMK